MFSALGWLSVGLYICAQAHLAFAARFSRTVFYGLNVGGAVTLAIASAAIGSWQAVAVNAFWCVVSFLGLRGGAWPAILGVRSGLVYWPILALVAAGAIAFAGGLRTASMDVLGWAGTLLYSGIYVLFASGRMNRRRYLVLNVCASVLLMPVYYLDGNIPSLVLNIFWAAISLGGVLFAKRQPPAPNPDRAPLVPSRQRP